MKHIGALYVGALNMRTMMICGNEEICMTCENAYWNQMYADEVRTISKAVYDVEIEQSQKEIAELQAREKELVEALENIIESGLLEGSYDLHTKADKIAREAIANVRGE